MANPKWQDILLSPGNQEQAWELFHENSKIGRHSYALSNEEVRARMCELHESLPFEGYPVVELPRLQPLLAVSLEETIANRASIREMSPSSLSFEKLTRLLHCAYGLTRENKNSSSLRHFRAVPSAGALYPLELFFYSGHIEGLKAGLYHYNPSKNHLRLLEQGNKALAISETFVQPSIALNASLIIFITALFERSTFKYGDRGYRFIFLEAGHVAQNINLISNALGLACLNIGGFFDREVDDLLGIDGLTQSTIYMIAIGGECPKPNS